MNKEKISKRTNVILRRALKLLLHKEQTYLEKCDKKETPATYESIEDEIIRIKSILLDI